MAGQVDARFGEEPDPQARVRETRFSPTVAVPALMGSLRVLIASDSALLLAGMHAALRAEGLEVAAAQRTLAHLPESAKMARAHAVLVAPANGVTAALQVDLCLPLPPVVVLLGDAGLKIHATALSRHSDCVCMAVTARPEEISRALREGVQRGGHMLATEHVLVGAAGRLTPREQEVLESLAHGNSNAEIAHSLWIGEETVKAHLTRVFRKLCVTSRTEAIAAYLGQ